MGYFHPNTSGRYMQYEMQLMYNNAIDYTALLIINNLLGTCFHHQIGRSVAII